MQEFKDSGGIVTLNNVENVKNDHQFFIFLYIF